MRWRTLAAGAAVAAVLGVAAPATAQEEPRQAPPASESGGGTPTLALALVAVGATGLAARRVRRH